MAYTNTIGILIAAKDEASAVIGKAASNTRLASASVNDLGSAGAATGTLMRDGLAVGLGIASIASADMAIKFQQHMEMLHTNAGVAQDQIDGLSQAILGMAGSVGQGPDQLAQAFYHIASAGTGIWDTAQQLDILRAAADGAAIGQANLDDTTYALTSAMASGVGGVKDAAEMMATLNAIVGAGDMKLQDLNGALSTGILSTAATFGISIQSVGTALATLTDNGEHADEAATRLRMTFALMGSPSGAATKQLKALGLTAEDAKHATAGMNEVFKKSGLSTTKLAADLRKPNGITEAMKDLKKHLVDAGLSGDEASAMLSKAFGGGRTDAALLTMLNNLGRMDAKFTSISTNAQEQAAHLAEQNKMASQKIKDAWADVQSKFIEVGMKTLPFVGAAMDTFRQIIDGNNKPVRDMADSVGRILAPAFADLYNQVASNLIPALSQLWQDVIAPLAVTLGGVFFYAVRGAIEILSALVNATSSLINFLAPMKSLLIGAATSVIAYKVAMEAMAAVSKLAALYQAATGTAVIFYNGVLITARTSTIAMTIAQVALNTVMKLNPFVLIASAAMGIVAAYVAVISQTNGAKSATDRYKAAQDALKQSSDKLKDAQNQLKDATFNQEGASLRAEQAQKNYNQMVKQYGPDSLEARQALHDMKGANDDLANATNNARQKTQDLSSAQSDFSKKKDETVLAESAKQFALETTRRYVGSNIASIDQLTGSLQRLNGTTARYNVIGQTITDQASAKANGYSSGAPFLPQNALGTGFFSGGLSLVGENGPEIVNLPRGAAVASNAESRKMMGKGGGTSINISNLNIHNNMDEQKFLANLGWRLSLR